MPNSDDIRWFKENFQTQIAAAIADTPFTVDMITAVACQETGFIWQTLRRKNLSVARVLELCVGDSIDASGGRKAFPQTKADLIAKPNGQRMFNIARQALVDMSQFIGGFSGAVANPNKFCHGYGIFQFDLQFFLTEPDYFLDKRYANFGDCLEKALGELKNALRKVGLQNRTSLTDMEMASVAIAYNTGGFNPSKGLKQGHQDQSGKFYGENYFAFLQLSKTVDVDGEPRGPVAPPDLPPGNGPLFRVAVQTDTLNLRSAAVQADNIIAGLPNGHIVRAVSTSTVNGFREVDTILSERSLHGFASAKFLTPEG